MKKNTILLILLSLLQFIACKKSTLETYSGENYAYIESFNIDGNSNKDDTVSVNFANLLTDTTTIYLSINTIGQLSEQARNFHLGITAYNSYDGDYQIDTSLFFIPADTNKISIPIHLTRQASLKDTSFILHFDLYSNNIFQTNFQFNETNYLVGHTTHRVLIVSNIAKAPLLWTLYYNYLGVFSAKKFLLILDYFEGQITASDFDTTDELDGSIVEQIGEYFQEYLNEMEADGNTIYEDDGSKMIMGPDVQ